MKVEKEIEAFIKWLKHFFKSNTKEKELILTKIAFENEDLYIFLNNIKSINKQEQEVLYEQLRGNL